MTIAAGTKLGPYEMVSPLGAGGMGEVWRGRDTRLDRSVAIKILPAEFAHDAQFKVRFEREAKTISQLTHPHICTLYDVGNEKGVEYLVMELLDFGLAKPAAVFSPLSGATIMPTEQKPLTREGTILGTFQYMAPEQLEGLDADARTDIFALGAVLYEMATGKRAFTGATRTSLIAAIVSAEPQPISQFQPLTPHAFEHVVRKCLSKDRETRWQSAYDIAEELRWIREAGSQAGVAIRPSRNRRNLRWAGVAALVAVTAILSWFVARRLSMPRAELLQFTVPVQEGGSWDLALAPDGRSVAFETSIDQRSSLWVQQFRDDTPRRLLDTLDGMFFWSADGSKIAYLADNKLKSIARDGGTSTTICDAADAESGTWSKNGVILFAAHGSIYRVADRGGEPSIVLKSAPKVGYFDPHFLPDGEHFLLLVGPAPTLSGAFDTSIAVASMSDPKVTRLIETKETHGEYVEPGYIVYTSRDKLLARRFDAGALRLKGEPLVLHDGVIHFATARNGTIAYKTPYTERVDQLVAVDRSGRELRTIGSPGPFWHLALAPDERQIALEIFDSKEGTTDVWTRDVESGRVTTRLTFTPKFEWQMTWSPDSRRIFFASNQTDNSDVYSMPATGGAVTLVYRAPVMQAPLDVSHDGRYLLVSDTSRRGSENAPDIVAFPLAGGAAIPVAVTQFYQRTGRFSPDGKWVAYDSDKSGRREVYLQDFPAATRSVQISAEGGHHPAWRGDGQELFYSDGKKLIGTPIELSGTEPRLGTPVPLFDIPPSAAGGRFARYGFAPAKNGQEFYLIKEISPRVTSPIHIMMNATQALAEESSR